MSHKNKFTIPLKAYVNKYMLIYQYVLEVNIPKLNFFFFFFFIGFDYKQKHKKLQIQKNIEGNTSEVTIQ